MSYRIAIYASGSGTNAENIAKHFAESELAQVVLVLTDVRDAGVVARTQPLDVDTYYVPGKEWREHPEHIADFMTAEKIDLVVLAGFMRKVDDTIVNRMRGRMLNIHPSLLPAYGGKGMYGHHVHRAVIAAGETQSGVTVHQVSEVMDGGEIVAQESVSVLPSDTPETLEQKIHTLEYDIYPRAIEKVLTALQEQERQAEPQPQEMPYNSEPDTCVAEQWADTLGVKYSEAEAAQLRAQAEAATCPEPAQVCNSEMETAQPEAEQLFDMHTGQPVAQQRPPMPPTNLIWCILSILFCNTICGIIATILSCRISSRYYREDYVGAEKASQQTQLWIIISFCLGVLQATIISPLMMLLSD